MHVCKNALLQLLKSPTHGFCRCRETPTESVLSFLWSHPNRQAAWAILANQGTIGMSSLIHGMADVSAACNENAGGLQRIDALTLSAIWKAALSMPNAGIAL